MSYPASPFNGFLQLLGYRMDTPERAFPRWFLHLSLALQPVSPKTPVWTALGLWAQESFCYNTVRPGEFRHARILPFRNFSWETSLGRSCQKSSGEGQLLILYTLPPPIQHLWRTKKVNYLNARILGHESGRYSICSPEKPHNRKWRFVKCFWNDKNSPGNERLN